MLNQYVRRFIHKANAHGAGKSKTLTLRELVFYPCQKVRKVCTKQSRCFPFDHDSKNSHSLLLITCELQSQLFTSPTPRVGGGWGEGGLDTYIKVTGVIVGNFEMNP